MPDIGVTIEAQGLDSILREAITATGSNAREISNAVYADMKDALNLHISDDVYDEYKPIMYKRRKDNPSKGVSLLHSLDDDRYTKQIGPMVPGLGWVAGISYEPPGDHADSTLEWHNVGGDELIRRLESKKPPYSFENPKYPIPERKFWQKFVEELIEGGRLERVIKQEFIRYGIATTEDDFSGVTRQSEDGNY